MLMVSLEPVALLVIWKRPRFWTGLVPRVQETPVTTPMPAWGGGGPQVSVRAWPVYTGLGKVMGSGPVRGGQSGGVMPNLYRLPNLYRARHPYVSIPNLSGNR